MSLFYSRLDAVRTAAAREGGGGAPAAAADLGPLLPFGDAMDGGVPGSGGAVPPPSVVAAAAVDDGGDAVARVLAGAAGTVEAAAAAAVLGAFSPVEMYGRYVDAAPSFLEWTNLPGVREARADALGLTAPPIAALPTTAAAASAPDGPSVPAGIATLDYTSWLKRLTEAHAALPHRTKVTRAYRKYIAAFATYLSSLLARTHPLVDARELADDAAREFAAAWRGGGGGAAWGAAGGEEGSSTTVSIHDVSRYATPDALGAALGVDGVKAQLVARGLKAGGTPAERAARLWEVRSLAPGVYPKKYLAPAGASAGAAVAATTATSAPVAARAEVGPTAVVVLDPVQYALASVAPVVGVAAVAAGPVRVPSLTGLLPPSAVPTGAAGNLAAAWCEWWALRLAGGALGDVVEATRRVADRRATKTREEVAAEVEAEAADALAGRPGAGGSGTSGTGGGAGGGDDDSDDDAPVYNKLNIPLGRDGKPIPVWLYKLHGLNIEYPCEICNAVYRGRRDFDRHFQEWRHAYGMRALGIPNTKHFHDVTRIDDARALWATLQAATSATAWRPEADEEFEDTMGNVVNRRTYEDLARHGLL